MRGQLVIILVSFFCTRTYINSPRAKFLDSSWVVYGPTDSDTMLNILWVYKWLNPIKVNGVIQYGDINKYHLIAINFCQWTNLIFRIGYIVAANPSHARHVLKKGKFSLFFEFRTSPVSSGGVFFLTPRRAHKQITEPRNRNFWVLSGGVVVKLSPSSWLKKWGLMMGRRQCWTSTISPTPTTTPIGSVLGSSTRASKVKINSIDRRWWSRISVSPCFLFRSVLICDVIAIRVCVCFCCSSCINGLIFAAALKSGSYGLLSLFLFGLLFQLRTTVAVLQWRWY